MNRSGRQQWHRRRSEHATAVYPERVPTPTPIEIHDPDDPRLADYRQLKERRLNEEGRKFVAESERVVRRLLESGLPVRSILLTPPRLASLSDRLPLGPPIYLASQEVMDRIAGFHVHRGCLAIGERPPASLAPEPRAVVILEDLTDVDNLGAIARHAAAFGAEALVLSPRCADPFYRKAIRVSLGTVFSLPIVRLARWPDDLAVLRAGGLELVGAVLSAGATPLPAFPAPRRWGLLLGAEGPGLSEAALELCDHRVTIPMSSGADSLNVATAGAIFLYAFTRR